MVVVVDVEVALCRNKTLARCVTLRTEIPTRLLGQRRGKAAILVILSLAKILIVVEIMILLEILMIDTVVVLLEKRTAIMATVVRLVADIIIATEIHIILKMDIVELIEIAGM